LLKIKSLRNMVLDKNNDTNHLVPYSTVTIDNGNKDFQGMKNNDDWQRSTPTITNSLLQDTRVNIFSFLEENDLISIAQVNHQFHEDSKHISLSQSRTVTVNCKRYHSRDYSLRKLLGTLGKMNATGKFSRFDSIKICELANIGNLKKFKKRETNVLRLLKYESRLSDVTTLNLSIIGGQEKFGQKKHNLLIDACIPKALSFLMPNLQRINLTGLQVKQSILQDIATHCTSLESITWNRQIKSAFLSGKDFKQCDMKEIIMDDSIFLCPPGKDHELAMFSSTSQRKSSPIFYHCNKYLERVSIKNIRYIMYGETKSNLMVVPQSALVNFVHRSPSLKWFRSNLTAKNVGRLKRMRPDVIFST